MENSNLSLGHKTAELWCNQPPTSAQKEPTPLKLILFLLEIGGILKSLFWAQKSRKFQALKILPPRT